jgi:hypothetical protein
MSGGPQLLPLPTVQNDVDMFWPCVSTPHNLADPFDVNGGTRYSAQPVALFAAPTGTGAVNNLGNDPRGQMVGQITSNGGLTCGRALNGFNVRFPLLAGGPATMSAPSWIRLWRFQIVFQLQVAVAASANNLTFLGFSNNGGGGPPAAGAGYFGLALETDGAWHWVSRVGAGGFGFSEDFGALIPGVVTPHMLDVVMLAATGSAPAQCQVYVDGAYQAPALVRNWGPGSVLPGYATTGTPAGESFNPVIMAFDAAQPTVIQFSTIRCSAGQFTPLGSQLF